MHTIDFDQLDSVVGGNDLGLETACVPTRAGANAYTISSDVVDGPNGQLVKKNCWQVLPNGRAESYSQTAIPGGVSDSQLRRRMKPTR